MRRQESFSQFKTEADVKVSKQLHAQVLGEIAEGEMDATGLREEFGFRAMNSGNHHSVILKKIQIEHGSGHTYSRDRNVNSTIVVPNTRVVGHENLVISLSQRIDVRDIEERCEIYETGINHYTSYFTT